MSEFVLDASAAGKLVRNEKESAALRAWMKREQANSAVFVVPPVFEHELRNLVVRLVRDGILDDGDAAWEAFDAVRQLVQVDAHMGAKETITTAIREGLTASDAAYLLLTVSGRPLVTYDRRLAEVCETAIAPS